MSDFPAFGSWFGSSSTITTFGHESEYARALHVVGISLSYLAAIWPVANDAIYVAVQVPQTVTAYQMAVNVNAQSGNCDVGIYDELGNRLVSAGSTAVGAIGLQVFNIADTVLTPGTYFLAMCVDNTTASFTRSQIGEIVTLRVAGIQKQSVGAVTLPNPATFANPANAYIPWIAVGLNSVAL